VLALRTKTEAGLERKAIISVRNSRSLPFKDCSKTSYIHRIIRKLKEMDWGVKPRDIVLDLGSGDGAFSSADESWKALMRDDLHFVIGDATQLPLRDRCVNRIFAKDVLHHIGHPINAITEIRRVTNHGGLIAFVESNRYNPLSYPHMVLLKKHQHFTRIEFRKLVKSMFNNIKFTACEAHHYTIQAKKLIALFRFLEDCLERLRFFRPYLNYSLIIATLK